MEKIISALVGYTGFVGSNLISSSEYTYLFNSKNINKAYDLKPDLLVYAGVRGTKFIANKFPEKDEENIISAIKNIEKIKPKKLVLISTVDVYSDLNSTDEDFENDENKLHKYGYDRLKLEKWVIKNLDNYHIIRIPALYGLNLKKNFVYDLINPIPTYLNEKIFLKINNEFSIFEYYDKVNEDLYEFKVEKIDYKIYNFFKNSKYNSVYYTDSRSSFQFFNLKHLKYYIDYAINNDIRVFNVVTEPISACELFYEVNKSFFSNITNNIPIIYNIKTKYSINFNNNYGYLLSKEQVLRDLKEFIKNERVKILEKLIK